MAKVTVITTRDIYGKKLEKEYRDCDDISIVFHSAPRPSKILNIFKRGSVSVRFLFLASLCRLKDYRIMFGRRVFSGESDLSAYLHGSRSDVLIMFRMGLIVSERILSNFYVVNVHVARLPTYAGLGSILSALQAGDVDQVATAHEAVGKVDSGAVIRELPYTLDPLVSYCRNERNAYASGIQLVKELADGFSNRGEGFE